MKLSHNIAALDIYNAYSNVLKKQSVASARISSGLKVSNSEDDPGAMAQSERINMQIKSLQSAGRNLQDGISMMQTTEGGLDEISSDTQRIRQLLVQGGDDTLTSSDKASIQNEIGQLVEGIQSIAQGTTFNGVNLLNDSNVKDNSTPGNLKAFTGINPGDQTVIPTYNFTNAGTKIYTDSSKSQYFVLGLSQIDLNHNDVTGSDGTKSASIQGLNLNGLTLYNSSDSSVVKDAGGNAVVMSANAAANAITSSLSSDQTSFGAINVLDKVNSFVISARSKYGALENTFENTFNNNNEISDKMESADSSIEDADIAQEMMNYTSDSVLAQAGTAMIAQANKFPQEILSILQNVK